MTLRYKVGVRLPTPLCWSLPCQGEVKCVAGQFSISRFNPKPELSHGSPDPWSALWLKFCRV